MKSTYYLALLFAGTLLSCNTFIDLPNFDEAAWQSDRNGCQGIRVTMLSNLEENKNQIKGLNGDEIIYVLGKPDKNELYKRNQKLYVYEIANAPECGPKSVKGVHTYLNIRFNATGFAKEVLIYNKRSIDQP